MQFSKSKSHVFVISGFLSITENCPETVSLSHSIISSPKSGYDHQMDCSWNLTTQLGKRITLNFTEFYINDGGGSDLCNANYIKLLHGTSSTEFCHSSKIPRDFLSDENVVSVKFHSWKYTSYRKFNIKYKSVTPGKLQHQLGHFSYIIRYSVYVFLLFAYI